MENQAQHTKTIAGVGAETGQHLNSLPVGHLLRNWVIDRELGAGGFEVTYLVHHSNDTDRIAVIREYLPIGVAVRGRDLGIELVLPADQTVFDYGRTQFIKQAQALARIDHPNVVRTRDYFEFGNTAYVVMDFVNGKSLEKIVKEGGPLDNERLITIANKLTDGLEAIHVESLHHAITPANIIITEDSEPVLVDIGAAREATRVRDMNDSDGPRLSIVYHPGYVPIEQIDGSPNGPWTDIYALGASFYFAAFAEAPIDIALRAQALQGDEGSVPRDLLVSPLRRGEADFSPDVLSLMEHALRFDPKRRPARVSEWRAQLGFDRNQGDFATSSKSNRATDGDVDDARGGGSYFSWLVAGVAFAALVFVAWQAFFDPNRRAENIFSIGQSTPEVTDTTSTTAPNVEPSAEEVLDVVEPAANATDDQPLAKADDTGALTQDISTETDMSVAANGAGAEADARTDIAAIDDVTAPGANFTMDATAGDGDSNAATDVDKSSVDADDKTIAPLESAVGELAPLAEQAPQGLADKSLEAARVATEKNEAARIATEKEEADRIAAEKEEARVAAEIQNAEEKVVTGLVESIENADARPRTEQAIAELIALAADNETAVVATQSLEGFAQLDRFADAPNIKEYSTKLQQLQAGFDEINLDVDALKPLNRRLTVLENNEALLASATDVLVMTDENEADARQAIAALSEAGVESDRIDAATTMIDQLASFRQSVANADVDAAQSALTSAELALAKYTGSDSRLVKAQNYFVMERRRIRQRDSEEFARLQLEAGDELRQRPIDLPMLKNARNAYEAVQRVRPESQSTKNVIENLSVAESVMVSLRDGDMASADASMSEVSLDVGASDEERALFAELETIISSVRLGSIKAEFAELLSGTAVTPDVLAQVEVLLAGALAAGTDSDSLAGELSLVENLNSLMDHLQANDFESARLALKQVEARRAEGGIEKRLTVTLADQIDAAEERLVDAQLTERVATLITETRTILETAPESRDAINRASALCNEIIAIENGNADVAELMSLVELFDDTSVAREEGNYDTARVKLRGLREIFEKRNMNVAALQRLDEQVREQASLEADLEIDKLFESAIRRLQSQPFDTNALGLARADIERIEALRPNDPLSEIGARLINEMKLASAKVAAGAFHSARVHLENSTAALERLELPGALLDPVYSKLDQLKTASTGN